jgi:hypothetical protein
MKDKYAGACWNALMEEETKESIAEMFMDALDELRATTKRIKELELLLEGLCETH